MSPQVDTFSERDCYTMSLALDEARKAARAGDFPAGAVLVVAGIVIDTSRSATSTSGEWSAHAELSLIMEHSHLLTANGRGDRNAVELFSSVEPCLMCFGAAVLHRIDRIVYAAPDPSTGFSAFRLRPSTEWYSSAWPTVERGLFADEALRLVRTSTLPRGRDRNSVID